MRKKQKLISDLKKDDIVVDTFVVRFKKAIEPYRNGFKFELRLADSSKEIMLKYWGPPEESKVKSLFDSIKPDDVVFVTARVSDWNGILELAANEQNTIQVLKPGEYDPLDFLRHTKKDIEIMKRQLLSYVSNVKDEDYRNLLNKFFEDPKFMEKFSMHPAAMYIHHAWIGGLLEHTLSVVQMCVSCLDVYASLDKDLVITGALLHDIGKLEEFKLTTSIKLTRDALLLGHVLIGARMVEDVMDELGTPKDKKEKILHMILTHMGEYGSSKSPAFPEALLVYYIDQMDTRVNQMSGLIENTTSEDEFIYHKDFGNIFLK